jgi:hypothetical protein
MNVLDENISEDERQQLQAWRIPVRQIGVELGYKGLKDQKFSLCCTISPDQRSLRAMPTSLVSQYVVVAMRSFFLPSGRTKSLSSFGVPCNIPRSTAGRFDKVLCYA